MLSRRQRMWDETIAELGLDPDSIERDADPLVALESWKRIARHLESAGRPREAAEAWDWAVSEALSDEALVLGDGEPTLWEASAFYERNDALGSLRATLEQAWASLRAGTPVTSGFAVRLLGRLAGVYERMCLLDKAAEASARAATLSALAEPTHMRRCA